MSEAQDMQGTPLAAPNPAIGAAIGKLAWGLIMVGALLSAFALLGEEGRERWGSAYLMGYIFCWAVVLGSLFFVGLQHMTRSVWSVGVRRVAEAFAAPVWLLVILFLPLLVFFAYHEQFPLFPWMDAHHVDGDHVLESKAPYLNLGAFLIRAGIFFVVWLFFSAFYVRQSLKQDRGEGGAAATLRMRKWSGPFLILFAFTVTFASFDWIMSLEPHWFSTIFGVYVFSGMTVTALATITLAVVWLRRRGWIDAELVTRNHLYSLGALLFAFTCFWAYIAFSQFMLIWYGNIPEETVYFLKRTESGWLAVSILLTFIRFVVPFFALLGRDAKSHPGHLAAVSILILLGQLVDLYWLIMPHAHADAPVLGVPEFGPPLLLAGILVLYVSLFLRRHRAVAVGDPMLEKSRAFHL